MSGHRSFEERFRFAMEQTKIHRARKSSLYTFGTTRLPYLFSAKSAVNTGETVVRSGEIVTDKPALILPETAPTFSGFPADEGEMRRMSVMFGRMFRFPVLRYHNSAESMEVVTGEMERIVEAQLDKLDKEGNSRTAVISGLEDCWYISLIIYAGEMMQKSAPDNLKEMMEHHRFNFMKEEGSF